MVFRAERSGRLVTVFSVWGKGCVTRRLTILAVAAATPAPPASLASAVASFGLILIAIIAGLGEFPAGLDGLLVILILCGLFLDGVIVFSFLFDSRCGCNTLGRNGASLVGRMYQFALFDQERLLRVHTGIRRYRDCDLETLLQITQVATLVIEDVERHVRAGPHDKIMCSAAQQRLVNDAQKLERQRRY